MKISLFILLFITGCFSNEYKQLADPEFIVNKTPKKKSKPPEPIELSYDKGLDLILVDTDFDSTISRILANCDEGLAYNAVYWNSNNNQYYTTKNDTTLLYPIPVSYTNFVYTIDETKQYEPVFDSSLKEIFPDTKASLLYIGSSSPLERVYLDPTNQVYYIKQLKFFDTSFSIIYHNENNQITNTIDSPIYPYIKSNSTITYFTNTNGQWFWITHLMYNRGFFLGEISPD